jgi:hypothetical protein
MLELWVLVWVPWAFTWASGVACACTHALVHLLVCSSNGPLCQMLSFPLDSTVLAWSKQPTISSLFFLFRPLALTGLGPVVRWSPFTPVTPTHPPWAFPAVF